MQTLETNSSSAPSKQFKATLCVLEPSNGKKPHQKVKTVHQNRPKKASGGDRFFLQMGPGPDRNR